MTAFATPLPVDARGEIDPRDDPFDRMLYAQMLRRAEPVTDGVLAHVVDRGKWVEVRAVLAATPRVPGAVGRWLDTLPRDRKVVVPAVVSNRLAGMLDRRGFVARVWWDDALWMEDLRRHGAGDEPVTATLLAIAAGLAVGFIAGLRVKHRRFLTERRLRAAEAAKVDAYDRQAFATDLAEVGPVTGPSNVVELFDQDALAEMRTHAERPCNNCGKAARFAWDDDGVPRAACGFCVSLWFEDGLPDWVRRLVAQDGPLTDAEWQGLAAALDIRSGPCSSCGTDEAVCTHLVATKGLSGCCGPCGQSNTHIPASTLPRSLPGRER